VFAVWALCRGGTLLRAPAERLLLGGVVAFTVLMSNWWCWDGAVCAGPRMLSDALPLLGVGLAEAWREAASRPRLGRALRLTAIPSVAVFLLIACVPGRPRTDELFLGMKSRIGAFDPRSYAPLAYLIGYLGS
jgi:hypothetical protein